MIQATNAKLAEPDDQPVEPSIYQRTLELLRQTDEQRLRDRLPPHFSA